MTGRTGTFERETKETRVRVEINLDGTGDARIKTGIGMMDHLLHQLSRHGYMNLDIEASGDLEVDPHHTVEDVAIVLGRALDRALGERLGIV
ncbi:MAG: hisB, partial [Dehalococcoidia bacterium]|nr:hisB [Dehalococcoidia bacterium]